MTRIENQPSSDREALKKEIVAEIKHDAMRKKLIGCGACGLVWLLLLGGGGWYVARLISKSGIADVPSFAAADAPKAEPIRAVAPLVGTKAEDLPRIIGARSSYDVRTSRLRVPISEVEMTTLVTKAIADGAGAGLPFPVVGAQVAIEKDFVEIFATVRRDGGETVLRLRLVPSVQAGDLSFAVREVMLGGLTIPKALGETFVAAVTPALSDAFTSAAGQTGGTLDAIELAPGSLTIVFAVRR